MTIALVLGGAACVYADVQIALDLGEFDGIYGCNHVGLHWPGIFDAWVSVHDDRLMKPWAEGRRRRGLPPHAALVGPTISSNGSSGMLALRTALASHDKAVLCGIPMDDSPHFDDPRPWPHFVHYLEHWIKAQKEFEGRVRSMGGHTAELFGKPDQQWVRT